MAIRQCREQEIRVYGEKQLDRKIRLEKAKWPLLGEDTPTDYVCGIVAARHRAATVKTAKLTRLERRVFILLAHGASLRQTAETLEISCQRVSHLVAALRRKLLLAAKDRYYGLHEVYWQEVRRYIYRKPRHVSGAERIRGCW